MSEKQVTSTFSERLIEALEYQGITDHKQQVEKIAQAFRVATKTAQKYLHATSCPSFINRRPLRLWSLADVLEVSGEWLYCGEGYGPYAVKMGKFVDSLPEWERNKCLRYLLRLRNDCPKARRLGDMCARGQITRQQLFAAM